VQNPDATRSTSLGALARFTEKQRDLRFCAIAFVFSARLLIRISGGTGLNLALFGSHCAASPKWKQYERNPHHAGSPRRGGVEIDELVAFAAAAATARVKRLLALTRRGSGRKHIR